MCEPCYNIVLLGRRFINLCIIYRHSPKANGNAGLRSRQAPEVSVRTFSSFAFSITQNTLFKNYAKVEYAKEIRLHSSLSYIIIYTNHVFECLIKMGFDCDIRLSNKILSRPIVKLYCYVRFLQAMVVNREKEYT